jgi:hypothetical protein
MDHRSIDVAASHCERLSAPSSSLSIYSLSVTGYRLRTNGYFAPILLKKSAAKLFEMVRGAKRA